VDELLERAWAKPGAFNLQAQRLDRITTRFGLPELHSRAAAAKAANLRSLGPLLKSAATEFGWLIDELNRIEFRRFLRVRPEWNTALDPVGLKAMDPTQRRQLGSNLALELATHFSDAEGRRVEEAKREQAGLEQLAYRMTVRAAAIARVETVLDAIAGQLYLEEAPAEQAAVKRLVECEALDLHLPYGEWSDPGAAFPSFNEDLSQAKAIVARLTAAKGDLNPKVRPGDHVTELALLPYHGQLPPIGAGKPLLLFFWSTRCASCKDVMPQLLALAQKRDLNVLAITDESESTLDNFFAAPREVPRLISRDPGRQTMFRFGVRDLPAFILLDAQGKMVNPATNSVQDLPE